MVTVLGLDNSALHQEGTSNLMTVSLAGHNNAFSFFQSGDGDTLTGTVSGDWNQVATKQFDGSDNSINFNVSGDGNVRGLSQTGSGNSIQATMSGNNGVASLNQAGAGNTATITQ